MTGERLDPKTKALILVCFVQAGGVVTNAHKRLADEGRKIFGESWEPPCYGVLNGFVKENPELAEQINAWATESYKLESYNRLESCTADRIVEYNYCTAGQLIELQTLMLEAAKLGNAEALGIFRNALYTLSKAFAEVNKVPNRFKDGYHPRQSALVDNSQHKHETLNLGEGVMGKELYGQLNDYLASKDKRFGNLSPIENGGNGKTA